MASSSNPKKIYHVFLSFRGTDLRKNFIGHLYKALSRNGMYTFIDDEELRKGDEISPALIEAIKESNIAIIVFSEDYASSPWCLEELAKILECKQLEDLMAIPLFYKVEPREVRRGRESFGRALAKHESKFGKDSEKVKRWKKALFDAGNLSGWHLNDGDESELIEEIVREISTYLARTSLHVAKHPVAMDFQVAKLKSMLNLEFHDDVVMVGLWGQGGIGKTSLAKAIYNDIFKKFKNSCFLVNVREDSKDCKDLVTLQEKLLFEILAPKERLVVSNVDSGINQIPDRLRHKKVLLILDDVDDLRQLNALVGESKWFGNGSRIIITTRDKHLLIAHGIDEDHVYEVRGLNDGVAHELLSKHAFPTHQKLKIKKNLVDGILNHAKGLPLALEVLGSFLCGRKEHEWESTIKKLSRVPNKTINDVLKISYDALEKDWKEIFLHIACFFKGWDGEYVKKVLDSCDLEATIGLNILIERALMSTCNGILQMHDLIQLMGRDVVNQECRDDPGRRSKLWLYDDVLDVLDVLQHNKGDCHVNAIVLELPEMIEMFIDPYAFTKMRRLRLLIMHNVSFQGPIYLPNNLRWLRWDGCTSGIPEFFFGPKRLVGLDMRNCNIPVVPNQFQGFQNLNYINFSHCKSLVRMPDLSCTPNLKELDLRNCKNLVEAHESIAYHDKLQVLNFLGCSKLSVFPNELKSKNLQYINLCFCTKFERFPDIPHKLEGLREIYLQGNAIKELPASIENLVSLKHMNIYDCKNLVSLPSTINKLHNIKEFRVLYCSNLTWFPKYEDSADRYMKTELSNSCWLDDYGCNQLIDPALPYEVDYESTDSEIESSLMHEDSSSEVDPHEDLQNCQMSIEEHSQIGSKRNHEFIFPQSKRVKTMLTFNLADGDENASVGWLHFHS